MKYNIKEKMKHETYQTMKVLSEMKNGKSVQRLTHVFIKNGNSKTVSKVKQKIKICKCSKIRV